ncbi:MAG: S-layer homology domain-containing protein [Eubacteriales bacterium]
MKKNKKIRCVILFGLVAVLLVCFAFERGYLRKDEQVESSVQGDEELDDKGDAEESVEEMVEESEMDEHNQATVDNTGLINIEYHSIDEILTLYYLMELDQVSDIIFTEEPDLNNFTTSGELDIATQQEALNTLNFARYIAGISYDVKINPDYCQNSQDAALALAALGGNPEHYIEQPIGMSDEMFASAYLGTTKGNLSAGIDSLTKNIIHGWLSDEGDNNLDTLGHRRTALSPSLTETGFGLVYADESAKYSVYTAMSVQGVNADGDSLGVAWPAQTMPIEFFDSTYPWSFSTGNVLMGSTYITITRENDGTTWTMIDNYIDGPSGDGIVTINNDYYGQLGCIIFKPDTITYSAGDIYHVEISGSYSASYTVTFFTLNDDYTEVPSVKIQESTIIENSVSEMQKILEEVEEISLDVYTNKITEEITRGEFAHMLGVFCDNKWEITGDYTTTNFADLGDEEENAERNKYIIVLNQWGVLEGTSSTTFSPDEGITREEVATILLAVKNLYLNVNITQDISGYADASSVSSEHLDGVRYMSQIGVLTPDDENCLNPLDYITVEEASVMCYSFFQ